jgi:hypothetical protein
MDPVPKAVVKLLPLGSTQFTSLAVQNSQMYELPGQASPEATL